MDKILAEAIANKIEEESKELVNLKEMISNSYEWTQPAPIEERSKGLFSGSGFGDNKAYKANGVYKIIHKVII